MPKSPQTKNFVGERSNQREILQEKDEPHQSETNFYNREIETSAVPMTTGEPGISRDFMDITDSITTVTSRHDMHDIQQPATSGFTSFKQRKEVDQFETDKEKQEKLDKERKEQDEKGDHESHTKEILDKAFSGVQLDKDFHRELQGPYVDDHQNPSGQVIGAYRSQKGDQNLPYIE
ncbi:5064_t:CDS:2 [Funneliformis geosporum]|uniref:3580_t:CDS:1 n=1 Tax=Funneliformis geosporum TaxID=1117311 RepID=A0A9W4SAH4_9GLOM|nr:5064_t:CDS:2 [Funneliformis geosporum]CAI2162723.1 3580_t:CDS:2 [Funneliformis geosporum]